MRGWYYIERFWEIPFQEKKIFIQALYFCLYYTLLVNFSPLTFYYRYFKSTNNTTLGNEQRALAIHRVRNAVNRVAILIPWRITCLVKSLAFKTLLESMEVQCCIVVEVYKETESLLQMHAYVTDENVPLFLNRKNNTGIILPIRNYRYEK